MLSLIKDWGEMRLFLARKYNFNCGFITENEDELSRMASSKEQINEKRV